MKINPDVTGQTEKEKRKEIRKKKLFVEQETHSFLLLQKVFFFFLFPQNNEMNSQSEFVQSGF